jgi:hypothetical protein
MIFSSSTIGGIIGIFGLILCVAVLSFYKEIKSHMSPAPKKKKRNISPEERTLRINELNLFPVHNPSGQKRHEQNRNGKDRKTVPGKEKREASLLD